MSLLMLLLPIVAVFVLFQLAKRWWPWLDALNPLAKQVLVVVVSAGVMIALPKLGLPVPEQVTSDWSAALVGMINGVAALGVHGVKRQVADKFVPSGD